MSIVSQFLLQSCSRTRYTNSDAWQGDGELDILTNVPCRFQRQQKQVRLPDGSFTIATGTLMLDGDADIVVNDMIDIESGTYKVFAMQETRGLDGSVEMVVALLG